MSADLDMGFETITAPAGWASALVNGDESGLRDHSEDAADLAAYLAFLDYLKANNLRVVDVVRDADGEGLDPRFSWSCDLHHSAYAGGDLLDYVTRRLSAQEVQYAPK